MERDLVVQGSSLLICKSSSEFESKDFKNVSYNMDARVRERRCPLNTRAEIVFYQESVEPNRSSNDAIQFALKDITQIDVNNDRPKQELTNIIQKIKQSSPKLMRKQIRPNSTPLSLNLSKKGNEGSQDNCGTESFNVFERLSPKLARKVQEGVDDSRPKSPKNSPLEQDAGSADYGLSKAKRNWRKVKISLKKLKDNNGESLKAALPSNLHSPSSDSSIPDSTENEDADLYRRMKAFLNNDKLKSKFGNLKSPRPKPKNGSAPLWSVSGESNFLSIPNSKDTDFQNAISLPLTPSPVSAFARKKRQPFAAFRRRSAPEAVLRQNFEGFHFTKKSKEGKVRMQSKAVQENHQEAHSCRVVFSRSDEEIKDKMFFILRENIHYMEDYIPEVCDRLGRIISENITKYFHSIKKHTEHQQKYACLVYIGAVRDCGIYVASRALWCPGEDRFLVADYQMNNIYGIAIALAVPS